MSQSASQRPTWAEVSLPALVHNFNLLRRHLEPVAQLMAVVKANAYGHGAVECAKALAAAGANWFGVALVEEGKELRHGGIDGPVFCLGGFAPGQADEVVQFGLTPAIFRLDTAEELNSRAHEAGRVVDIHLKIDTGMGRLGISKEEVADFVRALGRLSHLRIDGVLTHFANADSHESASTVAQISRYDEAIGILKELGIDPKWKHLANSAAIHAYPSAWGNLARAGASLFGLSRDVFARSAEPFALQPVLSLHSTIVYLKTVPAGTALGYGGTFTTNRLSQIATLSIGYADGLRRGHSNNGSVIVRGNLAPIVGRISMDLTLIDVTDVAGVALGDEAILIGGGAGIQIKAEDLAEQTGTISYEVVCALSARIPRVFRRTR